MRCVLCCPVACFVLSCCLFCDVLFRVVLLSVSCCPIVYFALSCFMLSHCLFCVVLLQLLCCPVNIRVLCLSICFSNKSRLHSHRSRFGEAPGVLTPSGQLSSRVTKAGHGRRASFCHARHLPPLCGCPRVCWSLDLPACCRTRIIQPCIGRSHAYDTWCIPLDLPGISILVASLCYISPHVSAEWEQF